MKVSIHSVNSDHANESRTGKTSEYTDYAPISVVAERSSLARSRSEAVMRIGGTVESPSSSGARTGIPQSVTKTLTIEFTKSDVTRIVEEALKSGLYPLPGTREIEHLMEIWQQLLQPTEGQPS